MIDILKQFPFFQQVSDASLNNISLITGPVKSFDSNNVLMEFGEKETDIFFVVSGTIRLYLVSHEGDTISFRDIKPGDYFGWLSIMDNEERLTSAVVLEKAKVFKIKGHDFKELLSSNSKLLNSFLMRVASVIRHYTERIEELSISSAKQRVLNELFRRGDKTGKSIQIESHEDFSSWIGLTRETVTRSLKALEKEKIIVKSTDGYRILTYIN